MNRAITFADACRDPHLFGDWFGAESFANWRVIDKAMFGLPLDDAELGVFQQLTGRDTAPDKTAGEIWLVVGRRGGKDVKSSALAVYLATIGVEIYGWRARLVRGERGVVQILAVDRDQAQVAFGYIKGFFEKPIFAKQLKKAPTADTIELKNGFAIEVTTSDQRRVRGRTVVAAIFDEVAFWKSENTSSPDIDVYRAVKPAMATMPGAMIIGISSPYARRGLLWQKYQRHFGKDGNVLVVKAPTWVMNPTVARDSEIILDAYESDPEAARAEYGAEFRNDIAAFVSREAVEACIDGTRERAPQRQHRYIGFVDPSGGSADSMTLAIAHREADTAILDAAREIRPPFSPEAVCSEFAALLKTYRISSVTGDKYAGEWVREPFQRLGIHYEPNAAPKSDLYRDLLPLINSRAVDLLDNQRMVNQLCGLERKTGRSGKDSIDHAPGAHDDVANAVAGALTLAAKGPAHNQDFARQFKFTPRAIV